MRYILNFINITILAVLLNLLSPTIIFAQYVVNSTPSPSSQININKLVQDPRNSNFVENLGSGDFRFLVDQQVTFRLDVKNNGQVELTNVQVKDVLPTQIAFVSGPGSFDVNTNTINFSIDKLGVGETKSFNLVGKIKSSFEGLVCVTNFSEARANNLVSQDTAMVCLQKNILNQVQELPKTGPGDLNFYLLGAIIFSGLAIGFAKKTL